MEEIITHTDNKIREPSDLLLEEAAQAFEDLFIQQLSSKKVRPKRVKKVVNSERSP
jgi:hypothetical protein